MVLANCKFEETEFAEGKNLHHLVSDPFGEGGASISESFSNFLVFRFTGSLNNFLLSAL